MTNPNSPYSAARIAALKKLVAKAPNTSYALDLLEEELKIHRDSCRRLNRRYGFYASRDAAPAPVPALVEAKKQYDAKVGKRPAPPEGRPLKRLFWDIEVSPNLVFSWRTGFKIDINYEGIVEERKVICIAYSWEDSNKVTVLRWDENQDDKQMLKTFLDVANEADELVGHYADYFDLPWFRTRCLLHGLEPLPIYKTIDTKVLASKYFYFNSNKLDYLSKVLGFGGKLKTDYALWIDVVLRNSKEALDRMCRYCGVDVLRLKQVFGKLSVYAKPVSHAGVLAGKPIWSCPRTGSTHVKVSKTRVSAQGRFSYQMQNLDDGGYYTINQKAYQDYVAAKS